MKKSIIILCLLLLSVSIVQAGTLKNMTFYRALKTANLVLPFVDYGLTLHLINTGIAYEANPLPALYVDKPLVAIPITLAVSIGYNLMTNWMRKLGWKGMGVIFQVVMVAARVAVIANSLGIMLKEGRR